MFALPTTAAPAAPPAVAGVWIVADVIPGWICPVPPLPPAAPRAPPAPPLPPAT